MCPLPSPSSLSAFPCLPLRAAKDRRAAHNLGKARMVPGVGQSRDRDGQHSSDLPAQGCPDAHGTPRSLTQGRAQGKEEAGRSIQVHGVNPSCATRAARAVPPQLTAIHSSCSPLLAPLQSCFRRPCPSPAHPCLLACCLVLLRPCPAEAWLCPAPWACWRAPGQAQSPAAERGRSSSLIFL